MRHRSRSVTKEIRKSRAKRGKMFRSRDRTAGVFLSLLVLFSDLNVSHGRGCPRVPSERMHHTPSNGNYVIRFSDPGSLYRPGEQYTGKLSPLSAPSSTILCSCCRFFRTVYLESAEYHSRHNRKGTTFTGFYLSVEAKGEPASADATQVMHLSR